jgi:hypothetical protein
MNTKLPQDYSLEKLNKTDGFQIYPPIHADFRFETLDVDDVDTLPDLPNYVDDDDYNFKPSSSLHMIPGDFDNDPNTLKNIIIKDKRSRIYHINGPPKKKKSVSIILILQEHLCYLYLHKNNCQEDLIKTYTVIMMMVKSGGL